MPPFRKPAGALLVLSAVTVIHDPRPDAPVSAAAEPAVVGIHPTAALAKHRRLFDALEVVFDVGFAEIGAAPASVDAIVAFGGGPISGTAPAQTLALAALDSVAPAPRDVRLSADGVDRRIRGITLAGQTAGPPLDQAGAVALATAADGPVWTRREPDRGAGRVDRASVGLPEMDQGETLLEALHGPRSLGLIALIDLLRAAGAELWERPALRCTFVFDDPNLRRSRYGHIRYRELLAHADAHGYHAAMALIPLDARCHGDEAVSIFRARRDRLSIAIHGNNHSPHELMATPDLHAALSLCAQSLRRIDRLESRTGLRVDRVMMPPHGGWSRVCARALGALGYDALCTTQDRPTTEPESERTALAGWTPAHFVEGCAVVPRLPLTLDWTGIALRAFIGQPLVLYGHHDDLACGLEPLASSAAAVNTLGQARWCPAGEIVETNYDRRTVRDTLLIRPWAARLRVAVPDGITRLVVQRPAGEGLAGWGVDARGGARRNFGEPVLVEPGEVTVHLRSVWETDPAVIASPGRSPVAVVRRRLSEARDRLSPAQGTRGSR